MNQRLPDLLQTYLRYHRVEGSTADTLIFYRKELGLFIRHLEAQGHSLLPQDVTAFDMMAYMEAMRERGNKPRTVRSRLQAVKTMFNWAKQWELVPENPVKQIKPPRIPKRPKPFMSEADFQKLLDICPLATLVGARRQAMLWLMVTTGIRRRELKMLTREDLEWDRGLLRIIHGKGQKQRRVAFVLEAQRVMLRYLNQRRDSLPALWITEEGTPLGYNGIGQDLARLRARAGVDVPDGCHILRRTFAVNAMRQQVPLPYVQAAMGHSTPHMVNLYVSWMEQEYEAAAEQIRNIKPFGG
ncbi:MAG: tyrosine-type recombinase/integrase [Dehalococcoidia bacterium]